MPQPRGDVSKRNAERLVAAMTALQAAEFERDQAIAAALKAGGSTREVAAITGLSQSRISQIGHANGWPTAAQQAATDRHKQELADWRKMIDDAAARLNINLEYVRALQVAPVASGPP